MAAWISLKLTFHHIGSQEREREPVNVRLYELMSAIDPPASAMPLGTLG